MKLRILREAAAELADATAYYESIDLGLGLRLKEEARTLARGEGARLGGDENPGFRRGKRRARVMREDRCSSLPSLHPRTDSYATHHPGLRPLRVLAPGYHPAAPSAL